MTEISHTNFVHTTSEQAPNIPVDAAYTIFEPQVETITSHGSHETLDGKAILEQMQAYADGLTKNHKFTPGIVIPLGSGSRFSVGEVADTHAKGLVAEVNAMSPVPEALTGILTTVAQIAEDSGFDRDKALLSASFMYERSEGNPNNNLHADGLFGLVKEDTSKVKLARFVYALGPGTLIYPEIQEEGTPMQLDYNSPSGVKPIEEPTDLQLINATRGASFTEQELLSADAQQVLPGNVLGFDPTQRLWHQAPNENRPVLVIDVEQVE